MLPSATANTIVDIVKDVFTSVMYQTFIDIVHLSAIGCYNYYSLFTCAHVKLVSVNQSVTHVLCLITYSVVT